jgi:hypothetical protein
MRARAVTRGVARAAAAQKGLVTADQLGVSRRVVDRLVAQGHLHPIHAGVFAVGHPRLSRECVKLNRLHMLAD